MTRKLDQEQARDEGVELVLDITERVKDSFAGGSTPPPDYSGIKTPGIFAAIAVLDGIREALFDEVENRALKAEGWVA